MARAVDACGGPMRRMRQKISKLNQTMRGLSIIVDALSSFSSDEDDDAGDDGGKCENNDEDKEAVNLTRRCPKLGSYKEKTAQRIFSGPCMPTRPSIFPTGGGLGTGGGSRDGASRLPPTTGSWFHS